MLLSTININRCGRWQEMRLIFNAIGCSNFGTISAAGTRPNCSNMLVLKCCGCIHPITSSHLQLHHFNQTAAISSTTKSLTKTAATTGNEQQPKPSESIETNENQNQQQTKSNLETTEQEQEQQKQNETDEPQHLQLAKASILIGPNKNIEIECRQGAHGQKIIHIIRLPNIQVPQDVYKFFTALDGLIRQLPVENPANSEDIASKRVLALQMLEEGQHYDFNFSIEWHPEIGQWRLYICSVKTWEKHREKAAHFPLWTLPQLRQQLATILAEHDGSERIGEMPTMPEWATQEEQLKSKEESEQTKEQIKADQPRHLKLAKTLIAAIGQNHKLRIECRQSSSGQKFINISMINPLSTTIFSNLAIIRLPQEAYKFLGAMDGLIGQLPVEAPANPESSNSLRRPILAHQMLVEDSQPYGFKFSVEWHPNDNDGQWHLHICSVQRVHEHKPSEVHFPLWVLPYLRQQMAAMLTENDGTEEIDDMPTVPEWAIQANVEDGDTENKEEDEQSESGQNESALPQQQKEDEPKVRYLAKSRLPLGPNRQLYIECEQGLSGHKTIRIYILSEQKLKLPGAILINMPKIHMPQDAYKCVAAMDRLIGQLPVAAPANPKAADKWPPTLANQMVEGGIFYDFQLSVVWFERGRQWDLKIRSVKTVQEHNEKEVQIPLWTLPLLRQKMATFLEKLYGTQRIDKMPTMPEWATQAPNIQLKSRYSN